MQLTQLSLNKFATQNVDLRGTPTREDIDIYLVVNWFSAFINCSWNSNLPDSYKTWLENFVSSLSVIITSRSNFISIFRSYNN